MTQTFKDLNDLLAKPYVVQFAFAGEEYRAELVQPPQAVRLELTKRLRAVAAAENARGDQPSTDEEIAESAAVYMDMLKASVPAIETDDQAWGCMVRTGGPLGQLCQAAVSVCIGATSSDESPFA